MQDQNCLIWVFLGWNSKNLLYCGILHQHPQFFLNTKIQPKRKILKFGTKMVLIGYFPIDLQKSNAVFEISILKFVNMQNFIQKQENFKFRSKILHFDTFGLQFNKIYYQIFDQHPPICGNTKFYPKQKNVLGNKNALFGTLGWNIEKLLSYL